MEQLELFVKGDENRTPLHTEEINKLVRAINAILKLKVSPEGAGNFKFEPAGSVLTLKFKSTPLDVWINGTLQTRSFLSQ